MKKSVWILALLLICVSFGADDLLAQCPMCRATAETNLANGGTEGKGLNNGIMYMLFTPYVLIGTIAILWWRNRQQTEDVATDETYV
ncbi:hypothetical protein [Neolewinella antarctica]|uniref:Uncharacterized protein n=1 Tax=Neolewinella antarctica TaxID=442734 RepID=A0ABX0X7H3_9BACT|nr:hypothetical protein [Neolewinella antarctica]NJC25165.1 hypothetical protein [Neolewinella antarctica]